jgi:hypothetical protein
MRQTTFWLVLVFLAAMGSVRADDAIPAQTTIVIFGDSQGEGVAVGMRRLLQGHKEFRLLNRTKAGSAISQKLDYDWPAAVEHFVADGEKADVAVMVFGGNDRLPARIENGRPIPFRTPEWDSMYKERITAMISALVKAHIRVIWCGDPIAREAHYSADMEYLNAMYQEVAPAAGAEYLPLWTLVADEHGAFAAYGKALDGETRRLRHDDGIHFSPDGYDVVANHILEAVKAGTAKPTLADKNP